MNNLLSLFIFVIILGTLFQSFFLVSKLNVLKKELSENTLQVNEIKGTKEEKQKNLQNEHFNFQKKVTKQMKNILYNVQKEIQSQFAKLNHLETKISSLDREFSIISTLLNKHIEDEVKEIYKSNSKKRALSIQTSKSLFEQIFKNQFPSSCEDKKFLICKLKEGCGFGCQLHKLMSCMIVALETQRVLVINSLKWWYFSYKNDYPKCFNKNSKDIDFYWKCFLKKVTHCKLTEEQIRNSLDFSDKLNQQ